MAKDKLLKKQKQEELFERPSIEFCPVDIKLESQIDVEYTFNGNNSDDDAGMSTPTIQNKDSSQMIFKTNGQKDDDMSFIKQKLAALEKENKTMKAQLANITSILTKQSDYLERLCSHAFKKTSELDFFPLKSKDEFDEIELKIDTFTEADLMKYIREIVGKSEVSKAVPHFFSEEFLLQINWDGNQNKMGIKTSKLFSKFVYAAVRSETLGYFDFEAAMRIGFRATKNKIYRKTSKNKSLNTT